MPRGGEKLDANTEFFLQMVEVFFFFGDNKTVNVFSDTQLHAEGVSIATIARCLDTMKIPTRRQGKGWDYHTVTAILKREGVYNKGQKRRTALSICLAVD